MNEHEQAGIRPRLPARTLPVVGAIAVGTAIVGFLIGVGREPVVDEHRPTNDVLDRDPPSSASASVVGYDDLASVDLGRNVDWSSSLTDLRNARPGRFDPVTRTPEMIRAALADRARHRAFDGAPPVVPHPVTQRTAASCLACHGEGLVVGIRVATKVSHPHYSSCTQCHVESVSGNPASDDPLAENEFVGRPRSGPGLRAMTGAPPTIRHPTFLREDCLSCHGLVARPGLRTTHPWLSNCVQCHAPAADLERSPFAEVDWRDR